MWSVEDQSPISSSSISTSRSSSSSSPFSPSTLLYMQRSSNERTMEEVWKDISLNNLQEISLEEGRRQNYREMIPQEFLARPKNRKESQSTKRSNLEPVGIEPCGNNLSLFNSAASSTVLSLGSGSDFQCVNWPVFPPKNNIPHQRNRVLPQSRNHRETVATFAGETVLSGLSFCKRVLPDSGTDKRSDDRRHKRMIKNRESAARSRARKQAYTSELEHDVDQLSKENEKLKKQQQQLNSANHSAMKLSQPKHTLARTLTSPF